MYNFISTQLLASSASKVAPYLILALYIVSMVAITLFSRKKSKSLNSFFLADRGLGGWMTAFAYGTTYFSSVVFIGYAGKFGMTMGLSAIWIGVANAVVGTFLAWQVLAKRTRNMTRALGTKTMPEFFEKRYENKNLKIISSLIIFFLLIPYSTSVYQGLGYLFEMVFKIDFIYCIIIMAVLTAMYLFSGGYFATALSDFIQGIVMIVGVVIMIFVMFRTPEVNGFEGIKELIDKGLGFAPDFSGDRLIDSAGFNLIILIILTSVGIWCLPQSVHKFYAVKDNKAINKAKIVSTAFALIIGVGAYLNGGFARLFFDSMPEGGADQVIPIMLQMANFSGALLGLIVVLVLSASMSTLSSLSLCGASALSIDVYKGYIKKDASENEVKIIMRVLCLVFVAVSAILAILKIDAIVTLMSLSWGTLAGCFLGPYVFGLYSKKITAKGTLASIIGGLVVTVVLIFVFGVMDASGESLGVIIKTGIDRAPLIGVIAMIFSLIITPIVSKFTQPPSKETLDIAFNSKID